MVGGYTQDLKNHRTVKIVGWAIKWDWGLARDNRVCHVLVMGTTMLSVSTAKVVNS